MRVILLFYRQVVRKIQSIVEENRREIRVDHLIHQLNNGDVQMGIDYAETWLMKRMMKFVVETKKNSCNPKYSHLNIALSLPFYS